MVRLTLAVLACALAIFQSGLPIRAEDAVGPASSETDSASASIEANPAFQTAKAPLTLEAAPSIARKNYPSIRAALAKIAAAQGGASLSKTVYLPRSDFFWKTNMHHFEKCG